MPRFSKRSDQRLDSCTSNIQKVFREVIKHVDCTVIAGHRNKDEQEKNFREGKSKVHWPNSKHNKPISEAVDVAPYINGKISWNKNHCIYFAGIVFGISRSMGITLRWGGDWNMDNEPITDQDFQDLVHFEEIH